jgi:hypothetical protein
MLPKGYRLELAIASLFEELKGLTRIFTDDTNQEEATAKAK